jgi:hypothetical protein
MTIAKENKLVRFNWLNDDYYFEFKITMDELTGDVSLIVCDFAEEDEQKEAEELWNSQISALKHTLGI